MANWRVLDHNPYTKETIWHAYDSLTDETMIYEVQDCTDILELNKVEFNATLGNLETGEDGLGVKVARIPLSLLDRWQREDGVCYSGMLDPDRPQSLHTKEWQGVFKRIRDPDYRFLRTNAKFRN
jgi:hypothetical protein